MRQLEPIKFSLLASFTEDLCLGLNVKKGAKILLVRIRDVLMQIRDIAFHFIKKFCNKMLSCVKFLFIGYGTVHAGTTS